MKIEDDFIEKEDVSHEVDPRMDSSDSSARTAAA